MLNFLVSDTAIQAYVAVLIFAAGLIGERHANIGDFLLKLADRIRGKATLPFFALCLLCVATSARAADFGPTITTTDGCTYAKAADGCYYPAAMVKASAPCVCGDDCKCKTGECPAKCPTFSFAPSCASGSCGSTYAPFAPTYAAPSCSSCSGGSCSPSYPSFPRRRW